MEKDKGLTEFIPQSGKMFESVMSLMTSDKSYIKQRNEFLRIIKSECPELVEPLSSYMQPPHPYCLDMYREDYEGGRRLIRQMEEEHALPEDKKLKKYSNKLFAYMSAYVASKNLRELFVVEDIDFEGSVHVHEIWPFKVKVVGIEETSTRIRKRGGEKIDDALATIMLEMPEFICTVKDDRGNLFKIELRWSFFVENKFPTPLFFFNGSRRLALTGDDFYDQSCNPYLGYGHKVAATPEEGNLNYKKSMQFLRERLKYSGEFEKLKEENKKGNKNFPNEVFADGEIQNPFDEPAQLEM